MPGDQRALKSQKNHQSLYNFSEPYNKKRIDKALKRFPITGKEGGPPLKINYKHEMERVKFCEEDNKKYDPVSKDINFFHRPNWRCPVDKSKEIYDQNSNVFDLNSAPAWKMGGSKPGQSVGDLYRDGLEGLGQKLTERGQSRKEDVKFFSIEIFFL